MFKIKDKSNWPLVRFIIPVFPEVNIFTRKAKKTTALGAIMVATVASKLWGWRIEVIDENNYKGPRDNQGLSDHSTLQKESPAAVVCFYCGLTSTIERVWKLAGFYHQEQVLNIAGGWHAHYCPEETLKHNIDVVVHGDGEPVIQQILIVLEKDGFLEDIPGISFMKNGQMASNSPEVLEAPDLDDLPYPDFGLLRYAKVKTYPIGRIRGCSMNCEFCSVRGKPRYASAQHLFDTVRWLVGTREARSFFIVDDRLEEEIDGTIEFFRMVAEKYGNRLHFAVQIRLDAAKNIKLLEVMKKAGVRYACVGYESPIDSDLKTMHKGYPSFYMVEWTRILHRYIRWIHAMFMVCYPLQEKQKAISLKEITRCFIRFIRRAAPDTVQILLPVPIPGSALRQRLEGKERIFPLELVPWKKYDGSYPCFKPDNMNVRELQEVASNLMSRFYNPWSLIGIPLRTISFPIDYFIRGRKHYWYREVVKCGGHLLIQRWRKKQEKDKFIERLEEY